MEKVERKFQRREKISLELIAGNPVEEKTISKDEAESYFDGRLHRVKPVSSLEPEETKIRACFWTMDILCTLFIVAAVSAEFIIEVTPLKLSAVQ